MSALLDQLLDAPRAAECAASDIQPPPPQTFQARCGRRRVFLSEADRDAYERGFGSYPGGPLPAYYCPESMGFFDAESRDFDRLAGSER